MELPATVSILSRSVQLPRLGNPTPRPTAAAGLTDVNVTFTPPIVVTRNWCVFAPPTSSVSLNVSVIVGSAGVGVVGGTGSEQPAANIVVLRTTQRIRFICP